MRESYTLRPDDIWELISTSGTEKMRVADIIQGLREKRLSNNGLCRKLGETDTWHIGEVFQLLDNRYCMLKELGQGAFGRVDEAWDVKYRRRVAIKRPLESFSDVDRRYISELYSNEALRTASLALAGDVVVKVLDYKPSVPYMVLEFCNSGTLANRMKAPYDIQKVLSWVHQISRLLSYAHGLQPDCIVHHDLKPNNILFSDEQLKVADFGGAMMFPPSTGSLRSLKPWGFTPAYAPPEAWEQETRYPTAFDIWSLGVIIYELLCGTCPFEKRGLDGKIIYTCVPMQPLIKAHLAGPIADDLIALMRNCLEKEPNQRPSAKDCCSRLHTIGGMIMDFQPVVNLGHWVRSASENLYKNNRVVLREVFQNALDAIRMLPPSNRSQGRIGVECRNNGQQLIVWDTGIGMTLDEQINGFWKPFGSLKRNMPDSQRQELGVVGQFGIGAYASFRVAQAITVISRVPVSGKKPQGTKGALKRPLKEYRAQETPELDFITLTDTIASKLWNEEISHGTIVILDLVDPVNTEDVKKWLIEAARFLNEKIFFNRERLIPSPSLLPTFSDSDGVNVELDISEYDTTKTFKMIFASITLVDKVRPTVALHSIKRIDGTEIKCKGNVWFSANNDLDGVTILKHGFPFVKIENSSSWANRSFFNDSLQFNGFLDLPFIEPNLSRDALNEESTVRLKAVFIGISWAVVRRVGEIGGSLLKECHPLFDFIWNKGVSIRHEVLALYPFTVLPSEEAIIFNDLVKQAKINTDLNFFYITEDAERKTREKAKALSNLDNSRIIKVDGPQHWRGYCLERCLQEGVSAKNLDGLECFTDLVDEEEMGSWKAFRSFFTQALDDVIGRGRQLQLARIQPKELTIVLPEQGGIVYANFNNPEIANLPAANLYGPELEAKIRKWAFGKIEAEKIEEALIAQGKLVVVQEVKKLRVINDPKIERYIPDRGDLFLLIQEGGESRYCLRVNNLCFEDLVGFIDSFGQLKNSWVAELNWAGNMFFYILSPVKLNHPSLVMRVSTGVLLMNPCLNNRLNGNVNAEFRFDVFEGPNFQGPQRFLVLPKWIGELLNMERVDKGLVHLSMSCQAVILKDNSEIHRR